MTKCGIFIFNSVNFPTVAGANGGFSAVTITSAVAVWRVNFEKVT